MANSNSVEVYRDFGLDFTVRTEQKTFTTSATGAASSFYTVPTDELWELRAIHATNPDSGNRRIEFVITDPDGTTHATLSNNEQGLNTIATGEVAAWDGSILVPGDWRIYARYYDLAAESNTAAWRLYAYARDAEQTTL